MAVRLTILVDNRAVAPGLATEHGFAMWIETGGCRILFDTGESGHVLDANARTLGVDLGTADAVCLSHGHYDHTGGLPLVLPRLSGARLYAHPEVFRPRYANRGTEWAEIGMALSREELEAAGLSVHLAAEPQEVCPGVWLTGQVERDARFVPASPHLCVDGPDGRGPDPFTDDQALALRTDEGLVVVAGCAHSGIVNLCRAALAMTGETRLRAVIGGFHLGGASRELLDHTFAAFEELDPVGLHPCHCTGESATTAFSMAFPERTHPAAAGAVLEY